MRDQARAVELWTIPLFTPVLWFRVLGLGLSLLVLSLMILFFAVSLGRPYFGADIALKEGMWVISRVDWAGLARQVGVQVGDVVTVVNGELVQEFADNQALIASRVIQEVTYLGSDGRQRSVSVERSKVPAITHFESASLFVLSLPFLLAGAFTVLVKPKDRRAWLLLLFGSIIGVAIMAASAAERDIQGMFELEVVAFISAPWIFLHFFLKFPVEKERITRTRLFPLTLYLPALFLLTCYAFFGYKAETFYPWFRSALLFNVVVGLVLGVAALAHSYLRATFVRIKQQIKILVVGVFVGIFPFVILSALPEVFLQRQLVPAASAVLPAGLIPVTLAYVIIKHRLLDVDLVIRRGLVYGTITAMLVLAYSLFGLALFSFVPGLSEIERLTVIIAFSVVFMVLFVPVKGKLQHFVDQAFYKDRYDFKQAMRSSSTAMASLSDLLSLSHFIVESVPRTLGLSGTCLLVVDLSGELKVWAASGPYADSAVEQDRLVESAARLAEEELFPNEAPAWSGASFFIPLQVRDTRLGILCIGSKKSRVGFTAQDISFLFTFSEQAAICVQNVLLSTETAERARERDIALEHTQEYAFSLQETTKVLQEAYLGITRTLVLALESRDPYTKGHSQRVAQLSRQIGSELGLTQEELRTLDLAARLHDIGKVGIPDGILLKPGPLSPSEVAEVQLHPSKSVEVLRFLNFLADTLPIIEGHHEWHNGSGYPTGLRGTEIVLGARILAVADAYDALTSSRPYRRALTHAEAIEKLKQGAGTQWDPEVVEAFIRSLSEKGEEPTLD